jgi:hypothetical protein
MSSEDAVSDIWYQLYIGLPGSCDGSTISQYVRLLQSVAPADWVAVNDVEGACVTDLATLSLKKCVAVSELLPVLEGVQAIDWLNLHFTTYPDLTSVSVASLRQLIALTEYTLRAFDSSAVEFYTRHPELVLHLIRNQEPDAGVIEVYKGSIDSLRIGE